MRYMVHIDLGIAEGNELERAPGGPAPRIQQFLERWKPEAAYFGIGKRELFMVVDLDPANMVELTVTSARLAGAYPTFSPVLSAEEFPTVVGPALEAVAAASP